MKVEIGHIEFYEVEEIKGRRIAGGKKEYFVKWKGFGDEENTWEPVGNLESCIKMVQKYDREHGMDQEKTANSKSPKPNSRKGKFKEDASPTLKQKSQADDEQEDYEPKVDVIKRSMIDNDIVFKVLDLESKKEYYLSRKDLMKKDPIALCLFYEKHIVS